MRRRIKSNIICTVTNKEIKYYDVQRNNTQRQVQGDAGSRAVGQRPQYIIDIMDRGRLSFCDEVLEEAQNRVDYHNFIEEDRNYELRRVFREVK